MSDVSSSRICACTITSSAVVGSSASSTFGSQASAIAIAARWRMPPENSCGNRAPGRGRDADELEQLSGARLRRRRRSAVPCSSIGSTICDSTVSPGSTRSSLPGRPSRCPSTDGAHRVLAPGQEVVAVEQDVARRPSRWVAAVPSSRGRGRLAAARLADQPEPLARVERRLTPWTAWSCPPSRQVEPDVEILDLEQAHADSSVPIRAAEPEPRAATGGDLEPRVERVLDGLPDQVAGHDHDRDAQPGRDDRPPGARGDRPSRRNAYSMIVAPRDRARIAETEERERRLVEDRDRDVSTVFAIRSGPTCGRTCRKMIRRWLAPSERARFT